MRLLSATLRNYRIHRELKVDFDASRTLIGGANESGKSTLVEAMHRALFLRAKGNTEFHRDMVSSHGGHPEVELQFESGGTTYLLKKRFGSTGTVTLTPANSPALTGDAAEAELARLLGVEPGAAGKVADAQWSHLWVWQRESGENPTEHANRQQASLIQRLQQSGGAVAMQSELDERVARDFSTLAETIFTLAGKAKVGSDLERAETAAASAQDEKNAATGRMDASLQAIRDFDESSRAIATANESLKGLENSKAGTVARLAEVEKLRRDEIERAGLAKNAASAHAFLEGVHNQIATLRLTMAALSKALEPEKTVSTDLATKRDQAKRTLDRADQDHESATLRTRSQRLHRDLAQAWVAEFEKATRREELAAKWSQIKALDESLKDRQQDLARLPALDSAQLKKIHKLENQKFLAEAALQALAARVEIITAKESVSVGGFALAAGETKVITEETDITAGPDLCIRIRPGGGAPLAETRQNLKEARRSLEEALEPYGLASVAEAAEIAGKRADLAAKIDGLKTTLGNLGADSLPGLLAEAEGAYTAAVAESQRRMTAAPEAHRPATLEGARILLVDQNSLLEDLESSETILKTSRNIASKTLMEAEAVLLKHHETMGQKTRQLAEHDAQLRLLLETHGDDTSRSARLQSLHLDLLASAAALQSTRQSLEALQPEFLANDLARLNRALEQTKQGKVEAEKKRAVANAALQSDGSNDPQAALALASQRVVDTQEHLAGVRRKSFAIKLLAERFAEEQQALSERFTRPLADKISGYLQCLFGPGARAKVTLEDKSLTGLELQRPGLAFSFDHLSGGAQEQMAAAVRLAIAEVLSANFDGHLPVVFDDAFAYSDPDRVQRLQRMLDLAASRGLQVIVLSCTPTDYAALGARVATLS